MDSYREIENLLYRYAKELDQGNLEGVAELFRHGEIVPAGADEGAKGYDGVLAMYQFSTRLYDCGTPRTQHMTTNALIEVDGDSANAHTRFTVMQCTDELPLQAIIAGHYEDSFERIDGAWRFKKRIMFVEMMGDLSKHLLFDPATLNAS